ncbi:MAG: flagellar biosynthetic protein FliO [Pseudomonadales bacterium]
MRLTTLAMPSAALLLFLLPSLPLQAADTAAAVPAVFEASTILKLLLSLGAIVLLIFALAWYARRLQGFTQGKQGALLQVLAATPVGARERVVLLRVGEEQVLLGVAAGRVEMLGRFSVQVPGAGHSTAAGFAGQLNRATEQYDR